MPSQNPQFNRGAPSAAGAMNKLKPSQSIKARIAPASSLSKSQNLSKIPEQQHHQPAASAQAPQQNSWGLADFSMPSADDINLWGEWQQELAPNINLRKEILAQTQELPQRIQGAAASNASVSNLNEASQDKNVELQNEWKKLNSETQGKLPWATELALAERQAERLGVVDYIGGLQKHEVLRMRTHEFLLKIHTAFREQLELFNESRHSPAHVIQLYKINNTQDDFMLFRNGAKLVVSGAQAGRILFGFNQFMGQVFQGNALPTTEISALWGPFEQLVWMYKGERVVLDDLVRYFFSEFVRQSFR